jgi:hypothetical protein
VAQLNALFDALLTCKRHRFGAWPLGEAELPRAPGAYGIYRAKELVYVGKARNSLWKRLGEHGGTGAGNRCNSPVRMWVWDRLIVPSLAPDEQRRLAEVGYPDPEYLVGQRVKTLGFRFVVTEDEATASLVETWARAGALGRRPVLNPTYASLPESLAGRLRD